MYWCEFVMDGQRVRQSTREKTERKAKMVEAELKVQMKAQLKNGHKQITLAQALERYAKSVIAQGYTSIPGGKIGDAEERIYPRIIERFGADTLLDDITGPAIAQWRDDMLAGGASVPVKGGKRGEKRIDPNKPFKRGSVTRYLEALRSVLAKAHSDWGCLRVMPAFDRVKEADKKTLWLEHLSDQKRLLAACPPHFRPYVIFQLGTGARPSEGLYLTWDMLDIGDNRRNEDGEVEGQVTFPKTKNGEARSVPLPKVVRDMLVAMKAQKPDSEERVFLWADPKLGGKWVPFNSAKVTMRSAVQRAGIVLEPKYKGQSLTLHTLRHTFASRLVKEGTDLYAVSKLLGHKSIKMTERYSHLAPSKLGKVVSILNSSLSAVAA